LPAKFIQPCLAVDSDKLPTGPGWIHEIKHDGYRMQVRKDGDRVRLFTRRGFDWTERIRASCGVAQVQGDVVFDGRRDGLR
jgi:bifunctional non-homologous end joining protein LigD